MRADRGQQNRGRQRVGSLICDGVVRPPASTISVPPGTGRRECSKRNTTGSSKRLQSQSEATSLSVKRQQFKQESTSFMQAARASAETGVLVDLSDTVLQGESAPGRASWERRMSCQPMSSQLRCKNFAGALQDRVEGTHSTEEETMSCWL